jgi:hypothetical protein
VAVEELELGGGYGLRLSIDCHGVPFERWLERRERLGRFFGPGLTADLHQPGPGRLQLDLLPASFQGPAASDPSLAAPVP